MEDFKLNEIMSKLENNKDFYKNNFPIIKIPTKSTTPIYNRCFFIKILSSNGEIAYPALVANSKCLYFCLVYTNFQLNIHFENSKENKTIIFHPFKRKVYWDAINKLVIVEIIKDDGLDVDSFFEIDEHIYEDNLEKIYSQTYFYSIFYSENVIKFTEPKILKISNDKIEGSGFIGSPIINLSNNKIIGMQNSDNGGVILREPIKKYLDILTKQKKENNEINKISLFYKSNLEKTKIFGKQFVERYKSKLKIVVNGEKRELTEYLNEYKNILEVNLIGFNNMDKDIDLSYMFHNCSQLWYIKDEFKLLSINKNIINISYFK